MREKRLTADTEGEELHRITIENILDPVFITDDHGRFTFISPNVPHILGYSVAEIQAMGNISACMAESRSLFSLDDLHRQGEIHNIEAVIAHKDGSTRDYLVTVKRVSIQGGTILYTCRDVTERKRLEERNVLFYRDLRESELLLKNTQELAKIGGWTMDMASGRSIWTDQVYRIHELPVDPTINHLARSLECYHPDDRPALEKAFRKAVEDGTPYDLELRFITAKGNRRWVRTMGNPVQEGGKVVRITGNLIDISARKKAEEERQAHIRFLESLERIDRAIKQEADVEQMLSAAVKTVFDIFACDRAWLLYPCDPDAPSFRVPVEITKPEYPGAAVLNVEIPISPAEAENMREALVSEAPVMYIAGTERPVATAKQFGVQSQMFIALNPKFGKHWVLGMHQCSHARLWTKEEQQLFKEISRRMSDGLSAALYLRGLKENEERFRATFEQAAVGIAHVGLDGRLLRVNQKLCDIVGYRREELVERSFQDITHPDDLDADLDNIRKMLAQEIPTYTTEKRYIRKDGSPVWINLTVSFVHHTTGDPAYFIAVVEDITRRKLAEEEQERLQGQLLQAQRMESVGRLAGGVAHDFNNMLSVILGYADLSLHLVGPEHPLYANVEHIRNAGKRAADLTRQLLAFARKQTVSPKILQLNDIVGGMLAMIRRLIGEDIDLGWLPGRELWPVKIDPSQIDQILANLCVNARDAIAGVGKVTIETGNMSFDTAYCDAHAGFLPGEYVRLAVSDDGCGMEKEVLHEIFDPFFTTKDMGKGTGLGLSTVYGIVTQNKGFINVDSEPGKGTSFGIYLPRYIGKSDRVPAVGAPQEKASGNGTILLVEDEPALIDLCRSMLESLGYRVLAAGSPSEAITLADEFAGAIDLVMTDVIMPEMNGRELCNRLLSFHPNLKRLFMSGYTADVIAHHGVLDEGVCFIQKPFSIEDLSVKVRGILKKD